MMPAKFSYCSTTCKVTSVSQATIDRRAIYHHVSCGLGLAESLSGSKMAHHIGYAAMLAEQLEQQEYFAWLTARFSFYVE